MSNRRDLKKYVSAVCGDLAASILESAYTFEGISTADMRAIINEIAALQVETLAKVSVSFDKTPSSMAPDEYRKSRRAYYSKAYNALHDEFRTKVEAIVKKINAALPPEVRESMKAAAK